MDLATPKVRIGSFFPSLLERRRRIDQALYAVIMEAYVHGMSTRSVDDLVKALGGDTGISKSEVSRICGELGTELPLLARQFPKARDMLLEAKEDLTSFADFPERHWKKIQSTNPLERLNREIKRRTDLVQIFPNPAALERLTTAVLVEMHVEWIAFSRRYLPEGSMDKIYPQATDQLTPTTPPQAT